MAGIGGVGDKAEIVKEGEPYPMVGVNEEFVDTPATVRRGYIVPVTKDIVIADRTGFEILRDDYTGAANGIVKLHARRRVGGRVVLGEAMTKLKIAA